MKNTLETRLGLFFALALVVAVFILELIGAFEFFKGGYVVHANFKNAQELKKGDLVKLAGVEIGRVSEISLEGARALITMKIRAPYEIRTDAKALIKFTGLMGQNYIAIEGGTDEGLKVQPGAALDTTEQPDLSAVLAKLQDVAGGVEGLTKSFSSDNLSQLLGPINETLRSPELKGALTNFHAVTAQIAGGRGTLGKLVMTEDLHNSAMGVVGALNAAAADAKNLMGSANTFVATAQATMNQISQGEGSMGRLIKDDSLYTNAVGFMANMREITGKINQGQGSVGKLVNDDSLFKNAKLGLQKLEKAADGLEDQGPLSVLGIMAGSLF